MNLELYEVVICLVGGFVAGAMNTLAGFGSILTIGIYTEILGLPLIMANGTNRVNVFTQASLGSYVFYKNGKLDLKRNYIYLIIIFIFSIVGVYIATTISNDEFKQIFKYILLLLLPIVLINPKRWFRKTDLDYTPPKILIMIISVFLGLYGGFIQMGMGIFFLITFVFLSKINIIEANALKVAIISIYTLVLIFIFHSRGLIDWPLGLLIASGQGIGAWMAAKYASNSKYADKVAYVLLITVLVLAIYRYWIY